MPAAATTIGGRPGQQALDVNVLLNILKKAIVLIPIIVMIIVFLIKRHLPEDMVGDGSKKFLYKKKIFHINIISVFFIYVDNDTKNNTTDDDLTLHDTELVIPDV